MAIVNAPDVEINGIVTNIKGDTGGVNIKSNNGGEVVIDNVPAQATVGAAGGASPLPPFPSAYLIINGYAVPAFLAS